MPLLPSCGLPALTPPKAPRLAPQPRATNRWLGRLSLLLLGVCRQQSTPAAQPCVIVADTEGSQIAFH
ncbi:hypothetical protein [Hymenobacter crusticola]|uniref:Uncharacterized protein n=1 Tax=Hymenobacter crusticola TaxID=1770526 RepID=A0A243W5J1_9BACT|nr:hypothetical protein [Hymenobacter crusticola]OUJ68681.1 hypothetical protein BXP70_27535 [Hymenobacter crusticola]